MWATSRGQKIKENRFIPENPGNLLQPPRPPLPGCSGWRQPGQTCGSAGPPPLPARQRPPPPPPPRSLALHAGCAAPPSVHIFFSIFFTVDLNSCSIKNNVGKAGALVADHSFLRKGRECKKVAAVKWPGRCCIRCWPPRSIQTRGCTHAKILH